MNQDSPEPQIKLMVPDDNPIVTEEMTQIELVNFSPREFIYDTPIVNDLSDVSRIGSEALLVLDEMIASPMNDCELVLDSDIRVWHSFR